MPPPPMQKDSGVEHINLLILSLILLLGAGTSGVGLVVAIDHAWVQNHAAGRRPARRPPN